VEEGKIVYPAGETRDFDGIKAGKGKSEKCRGERKKSVEGKKKDLIVFPGSLPYHSSLDTRHSE
jgi:hypothetical protein